MVKVLAILTPLLHWLSRLAGMTPETIEIEPGTVMKFWIPTETINKKSTKSDDNKPNYSKPNKPVLVFVHPFGLDGILTWFFQVLSFSRKYAVYVPDLIFFGGSITDKPDRSTGLQADCLAAGMRKLGVDKCTLVGLGYGGMVVFKMAKLHPQLVESLVVSSTVYEFTESISKPSLARFGFGRWPDYLLPESVEGVKLLLSMGTHKLPWLPDFAYKDMLEVMFNNRKEKAELLEALEISDKDATAHQYPQRIGMLWGDDDKIFILELAQNMKEQFGSKATLQCIENAGHLSQMERPFVFNQRLSKILESFKIDEE